MARIRTVKPEFWTDSKTGTLSEFSKCLFLGLLNHSDDYGVLEWSPLEWRAKIFPYHSDTTTGSVQASLADDLLARGLVVLFTHEGDDGERKRYIFIRNFRRHQVINKPSKPLLDGWKIGDDPKSYSERKGIDFAEFTLDSDPIPYPSGSPPVPLLPGKERKGEEGKEKDAALTRAFDDDGGEVALFARGKQVLGSNAGGLIANLLKYREGKIPLARADIERASTKQNSREYIGRILAGEATGPPERGIIDARATGIV